MRNDKKAKFSFESALTELDQLVEKMEAGGLNLEQALCDFERGIMLTRQCQDALKAAEQKVQILLHKDGELALMPVTPAAEEDDG